MLTYKMAVETKEAVSYIAKLIVDFGVNEEKFIVDHRTFSVYGWQQKKGSDAASQEGNIKVLRAYPCDGQGKPMDVGPYIALELEPSSLCVYHAEENHFRITQNLPLPGKTYPLVGMVFDHSAGQIIAL